MTVDQMIEDACFKAGLCEFQNVPSSLYAWALTALNRLYQQAWNAYPFRDEKMVLVSVAVAANATEIALPAELEAIRALSTSDEVISPLNEIIVSTYAPDYFDDTGTTPAQYMMLPDGPVTSQPGTGGRKLSARSDSASDVGFTVRIWGTIGGVKSYNDITLNGLTGVATSGLFTEILGISKPVTTGRITILDYYPTPPSPYSDIVTYAVGAVASYGGYTYIRIGTGSTTGTPPSDVTYWSLFLNNTYGTIAPWETQGRYRRIRLAPIPSASVTVYAQGLRRWTPLIDGNDTIILARCEGALYDQLMAELYEYGGEPDKAANERAKANDKFGTALKRENEDDPNDNRSFPAMGMFYDDSNVPADTTFTGVSM